MPEAPSVAELVDQFELEASGRERGLKGLPPSESPRLDSPETKVVAHCQDLFQSRLEEYRRHSASLEERIRTPGPTAGTDADVEAACLRMKQEVDKERPELEGLAETAQKAISDLNRFRSAEKLTRDADYPESRLLHMGFLLALVVVETFVNGLFFGANVSGGIFAGMSYAVLISVVNVVGLGLLAAVLLRMTKHRDPSKKMVGWTISAVVAAVAVSFNLLVGHYREALAVDYPPAPDTVTINQANVSAQAIQEQNTEDQGIEACWIGPEEADADQEALCLFSHNPIRLGGFQSYMLLLIGLLWWLLGAADWFRQEDPYPGYSKLDRRRKKAERELADERIELLEEIEGIHDRARVDLKRDFTDPVDSRALALTDFRNLTGRHADLVDFRRHLEASARGALDIYRASNADTRSTPEPRAWEDRWAADWRVPEAPDESAVMSEQEAEKLGVRARAALEERETTLRNRLRECQTRVDGFTELHRYDGGGPR